MIEIKDEVCNLTCALVLSAVFLLTGCDPADDAVDTEFGKASVEVWEITRRANADIVIGQMDVSRTNGWMKASPSVVATAKTDETGPFLRLGNGMALGISTGVQPAEPVAVEPGRRYTISFEARAHSGEDIAMFYLRTLDEQERNVTNPINVPDGWSYTIGNKAYWENGFHFNATEKWQTFSKAVTVPRGVRYLVPIVAMWRGRETDVRNLRVTLHEPTDERRVDPKEIGLVLDVTAQRDATGACTVRATVTDKTPRSRALKVALNLARDLTGWNYHGDWRSSAPVAGGESFCFDARVGGHPVSRYPFSAVSKDGAGFAVGTAFDAPVFESRCVTTNGVRSTYVLGLLPRGEGGRLGTTATVEWLILPFRGNWGFRSAARAYYAREAHKIPDLWRGRREGAWIWPIWPSRLPKDPDDFGLVLWEAPSTIGRNKAEIAVAHKMGIEVYPYTEAWGMRQEIKKKADGNMTTVEERLAELKAWAAEEKSRGPWQGMPRNVAARACLNSLPVSPDGTHPFSVDNYGTLTHWWRTNPDPRLTVRPCRHSICWESSIGLDLDAVDGVYLDSVTVGCADYNNVRPEHLAVVTENLIYDPETAQPCSHGMQHQVAFISHLASVLHPKGKRIFGNAFEIAQRFHATTSDIFGSEVGGWGGPKAEARQHRAESDAAAGEKRFYAYHRPVSNLLQEGRFWGASEELSAKGVENYIEHQLFYGFFPAISTIGGDKSAGYAKWMRYFGPTRQCERDRAAFRRAIPLIRKLNAAGWEPETFLRSSFAHVWVERYGATKDGKSCYFTLRNDSDKACEVELTAEQNDEVRFSSLKSLWKLSDPIKTATGWKLSLAPWATAVLSAQ